MCVTRVVVLSIEPISDLLAGHSSILLFHVLPLIALFFVIIKFYWNVKKTMLDLHPILIIDINSKPIQIVGNTLKLYITNVGKMTANNIKIKYWVSPIGHIKNPSNVSLHTNTKIHDSLLSNESLLESERISYDLKSNNNDIMCCIINISYNTLNGKKLESYTRAYIFKKCKTSDMQFYLDHTTSMSSFDENKIHPVMSKLILNS